MKQTIKPTRMVGSSALMVSLLSSILWNTLQAAEPQRSKAIPVITENEQIEMRRQQFLKNFQFTHETETREGCEPCTTEPTIATPNQKPLTNSDQIREEQRTSQNNTVNPFAEPNQNFNIYATPADHAEDNQNSNRTTPSGITY